MLKSKGARARALGAGLALAIGGGVAVLPTLGTGAGAAGRGPVTAGPSPLLTGASAPAGGGTASPGITPDTAAVGSQLSEISAVSGGAGDFFGVSVAISGTTAVVGAPDATANGNADQGVVRIYLHSGTAWVLQAEFTSNDGAAGDFFGDSVAISGSTVVVGAPNHTVGGITYVGAAYVFTKSGVVWTQTGELVPSDSNADGFGTSVSTTGTVVVAGDPDRVVGGNEAGAAFVFTKSGAAWVQRTELNSPFGALNDNFGYSVSLSGTTLAVGSPLRTEGAGADPDAGAVDIYTLASTGAATRGADTTGTDTAADDSFGWSLSASGTTVLVGAPYHNAYAGAAYVFAKSGSTWVQSAKLQSGIADDYLGYSVGLGGTTTAVLGAPVHTVGSNFEQGGAYVFTKSGSTWNESALGVASDGNANDILGVSVGVSGTTAIAGAPQRQIGSDAYQGAAYFFQS